VKIPGRFISKDVPLRDSSGDPSEKRDMVRGISRKGGEGGGRETVVPGVVDKGAIKTDQDRELSTIGPGIAPVPQGELNKAKLINGVIKQGGLGEGKVIIIPVRWIAGEVEVARNKPRG
jgi:hypothetical protein